MSPIIGVDSSGQVKNPPVWMVATRKSKKKGQRKYVVYVSREEIEKFRLKIKNWNEKISAILIFRATRYLFHAGDVILVDRDFSAKTRKYVEKYTKRLFGVSYCGKPHYTSPPIIFSSVRDSPEIKEADIKSNRARHGTVPINEKNPDFAKELEILS
jgi:hypothetical protein